MERITLPSAKALHLPFCSAVRAGDFLFLSGAIGNRPGTMALVEGGLPAQARQAMENIGEVLAACGLGFADTVKFTIMLADMRRWAEFNAVYLGYFDPDRLPARSAFGASGLAHVESRYAMRTYRARYVELLTGLAAESGRDAMRRVPEAGIL